ncbi:MAG: DNA polymerase [Anaerolineae bacterium]
MTAGSEYSARRYQQQTRWRRAHPETVQKYNRQFRANNPKSKASMLAHTFIGVDGEGWTDAAGRHHYITFTVGGSTLYTGKPLTMREVFAFLDSQELIKNRYFVSFFFDYDVTMILRALPPDKAKALFTSGYKYVWHDGFGIRYIPKKRLTIKRWTADNKGKAVTVHDLQGFFQCSFVNALDMYQVGTAVERKRIAGMKELRSSFTRAMAQRIIKYSELECKLLAQMAEILRDRCHDVGLNPSPYEGPGYLASRALAQHFTKEKHDQGLENIPKAAKALAARAYYGGRFEVLAHGVIDRPVYEYDLKSAYPAATQKLPCLIHGKWKRGIHSDLYISKIRWNYTGKKLFGAAMPFPVRLKAGLVMFPARGEGWYWSHEIEPAKKYCDIEYVGAAYSYINNCDCKPFSWLPELFDQRQRLEHKRKNSGIALKLALNSLYGKMAQTRPSEGRWFNLVYASLITSIVRAQVFDIYRRGNPVVMFATDAVFTLKPLAKSLLQDTGLGAWELAGGKPYPALTIFQPGIYFNQGQAKFKTRGVPKKVFETYANELEEISLQWEKSFPTKINSHLSLRLAHHRGTPEALGNIGNWIEIEKNLNANPWHKRVSLKDGPALPYIKTVDGVNWSAPYSDEVFKTVPWSLRTVATQDAARREDAYETDGYYDGDI